MLGMPLHMVHAAQALHGSTGNPLRPALGCMHLPGLSCSGLALRLSVGPAFCALPRTEYLGCLASAVAATYRLSLLLSFLGVLLAPLARQMVTVQNPKKS